MMLAACALSACAGDDAGESTEVATGEQIDGGLSSPRDARPQRDGGRTGLDASLDDDALVGDAGARSDAASAIGADGGTGRCGDVVAASHPPLAAVRKLATTTDEVRVLVYGQSISEQSWWSKTKAWLERTYPRAKLVMEQHAHGGCPAQCLIGHEPWFRDGSQYNRLPEDVFAFRPDLVIFHVYGDHNDYGYIMKAFKEGCAAFDDYKTFDGKEAPQVKCTPEQRAMAAGYRPPEVIVQNDFPQVPSMLATCPSPVTPENWSCYMNELVIPEQVAMHGYTLQDNFHEWRKQIEDRKLDLKTLVADDDTHLRDPGGTDLMFQQTIPHLCYTR